MPAWPDTLPPLPGLGVTLRRQDAVSRSAMDAGPPTRRNRFTAVARPVSFPITLTGAQLQVFEGFFATTLANGALSFDWVDPVTSGSVSLAFTAPPEWALVKGGDAANRLWRAALALEIQP